MMYIHDTLEISLQMPALMGSQPAAPLARERLSALEMRMLLEPSMLESSAAPLEVPHEPLCDFRSTYREHLAFERRSGEDL
jgi:hypothetical protein